MAVDKLMNETQGDDIIDRLEEIADKIHDINYGLETSSNKVVSMSGYQKESTAAAISPGDSLNVAVGKLEKKVDDNTANKVAGPQSAAVGNIATFANVDGKSVQDSEVAIVTTMDDTSDAEVPTSEAIGEYITDQKFAVGLDDSSSTANHLVKFKDNNGKNLEDTGISVETSSASALSNDDNHIPTSKLVKTEVDKKVTSIKAPVSGSSTKVDKNNEVAFQQASGTPAVTVTGDATNGTVTIEHATGAGFNHIPTSGTSGQYLKNTGTAGSATWTSPLTEWPATPEHTDTLPSTKLLDDRFDADEANILYAVNKVGKNLVPLPDQTFEQTGVTVDIKDGVVKVNGQSTITLTTCVLNTFTLPAGTHIISGGGDSATGSDFFMRLGKASDDSYISYSASTSPVNEFTLASETSVKLTILLNSSVGTVTNVPFYPMICTKDVYNQDSTFEPYGLPNSELTKEVNILRASMDNLFRTPVFGFRINKNESASNTAVEYLYDAVGMTPAGMDFTNSTFNYGSWSDAWFVKNNKPVALNFDGTEAFELDPTNWWKKSDGTTDSGIEDESTTYNFMSRFPLVYINRWEDENYNYVAVSERPVTPNFLAQAHTGLNGTINSNIYLPMFKGWIDGSTGGTISSTGKFRSLAGKWPSCGTDATEEFNAIMNITGSATSGWQLFAHSQYCLLNDLLTLISKSIDVKACFGRGDISTYTTSDSTVRDGSKTGYPNNGKYISGYEGYASGTTTKSTCGQFFGYDDATHHVTAFFVQDPWGNRWDRSPGLNRINRAYKVKMTPPYSMNSDSSYITAGIQTPSSDGWLRKISSSNTYGHLPFAVGDGAADTKNKYFWSYFYTNSNTDEKLSLVGGSCDHGGGCSSRYVNLNNASSIRAWCIGGSPCFVSP